MQDWIDAHSHLADPRISDASALIAEARAAGIQTFLQGGVGPEDWQRQKQLASSDPGVWPVFGLHPYWVAAHTQEECESALNILARELPSAVALGETGLDFRPQILQDSEDRQISCFEAQLELARVADKPLVMHIVRAFKEASRILDLFGQGTRGMVHSFNGSWPEAKSYIERGYLLSIGGPVCRDDNHKLHQAVREIPMDFLLVETDSPDQPPPGVEKEHNTPVTLLRVADQIAALKGLGRGQILDKSRENLRKLLRL